MVRQVGSYVDDEGLHIIVFNEDGSIFEHRLKSKGQITNEDLARLQQ